MTSNEDFPIAFYYYMICLEDEGQPIQKFSTHPNKKKHHTPRLLYTVRVGGMAVAYAQSWKI